MQNPENAIYGNLTHGDRGHRIDTGGHYTFPLEIQYGRRIQILAPMRTRALLHGDASLNDPSIVLRSNRAPLTVGLYFVIAVRSFSLLHFIFHPYFAVFPRLVRCHLAAPCSFVIGRIYRCFVTVWFLRRGRFAASSTLSKAPPLPSHGRHATLLPRNVTASRRPGI